MDFPLFRLTLTTSCLGKHSVNTYWIGWIQFSSVQFSCSVVSNFLQPHGLQHARPPCPSPTPGVHSDSCSSSQWCHPAIKKAYHREKGNSTKVVFGWVQTQLLVNQQQQNGAEVKSMSSKACKRLQTSKAADSGKKGWDMKLLQVLGFREI